MAGDPDGARVEALTWRIAARLLEVPGVVGVVLNEKGLIAGVSGLRGAPAGFAEDAAAVLASLTPEPGRLIAAIGACRAIVDAVPGPASSVVAPSVPPTRALDIP